MRLHNNKNHQFSKQKKYRFPLDLICWASKTLTNPKSCCFFYLDLLIDFYNEMRYDQSHCLIQFYPSLKQCGKRKQNVILCKFGWIFFAFLFRFSWA